MDASRFWLSEAVARSLRLAARGRPRVLVLEDLHAADDASIEVLGLLAPDLAQSRILTIATSRDDVGGRFSRRLRPCDVIFLSGLTVAEVERYLADTVGDGAQPDLAQFVHARTGGNPLLLKEAARMVIAQNEREAAPDARRASRSRRSRAAFCTIGLPPWRPGRARCSRQRRSSASGSSSRC